MQEKRKNLYQVLLDDIIRFCRSIRYAPETSMYRYPKDKLGDGWSLNDLCARVKAADQLGYDVIVKADDDGLLIRYRKRIDIPYQWR